MIKTFFGSWWRQMALHIFVLTYFFAKEYFAKPGSTNDLNLGGAAVIVLSCLVLVVSTVFHLMVKRFVSALINMALHIGTVLYLFV